MSRRPRFSLKGMAQDASKKALEESEPVTAQQQPQVAVEPADVAEAAIPEPRTGMLELRILQGLVILLALHAAYAFLVGFGHNISDRVGFRQAQTAVAARALLEGSPWFAYQLPVFGPPYGLPIEFPLYQWITALLVAITHMPLIAAGRIVSILCFLASAWALWKILDFFHTELKGKLVIAALLLVCPIYLFWSRAFMIETCALGVCMWFTLFALRASSDFSRKNLAIAAALGVLAGMVKITTLVPFWVALACWLAVCFWKRRISLKNSAILAALLLIAPILAGMAWVRFADSVVARNELAASFLLSSTLHKYVFGTLADRVLPELWDTVSARMLPEVLGTTAAFFGLLVLLPLAQRYSRHVAICTVLFFVAILVNPHLQRFHPYYQTANGIFLIAAAGFLIFGLMHGGESHRIAGYAFFVLLIAGCLYRYYNSYFPFQQKEFTGLALVGAEVEKHARPDQLIIVKGHDWNSEIPFYSHRRALMNRSYTKEQIQRRIQAAAPATVGDILYCFDARKEHDGLELSARIARIQQEYGLVVANASDDGMCLHYFSSTGVKATASLPFIGAIDMPKDNESVKDSMVVAGWALSGQPIKEISISIDGQGAVPAKMGSSRPDLAQPYPQYPGHPFNGYGTSMDLTRLKRGPHTVSGSAVLQDGSAHPFGQKTFVIP
ncbi:MAG TPA: glycosyltransferase family 39 protein [Bryobacteraceae bacterium]